MSRKLYLGVMIGTLVAMLAIVNVTIWQRENLLRDGTVVLLELAPVDPRSLMQGDYMALRFALAQQVSPELRGADAPAQGEVVVKRDAAGVGVFERIDSPGAALAANESRIQYRLRRHNVRIVTNAYFFQEGTAHLYAEARYGELRVAKDGTALLIGMRDKDLKPLGNSARR